MELFQLKAEAQYELGKCNYALKNINKAIDIVKTLKPEYEADGKLFFLRSKENAPKFNQPR